MTTPWEDGQPDRNILVLGEAPAKVEMVQGKPLVGPSGQVFKDCLNAAGLARSMTYILNVWPFEISKDRKGTFWVRGEPQTDPDKALWTKKEGFTERGLQEAEPTLARIRASDANIILTLGQQAMELCLGSPYGPIGKWRGSVLQGHERVSHEFGVRRRKIIPTYHPAATLHGTYTWRHVIINDMQKVAVQKVFPEVRNPQRNLIVEPPFDDVMDFMKACKKKGRFATDLEVLNHQVSCFSLSHSIKEAMTVPMRWEHGEAYWTVEQEIKIWEEYAKLMGDPAVEKINQNIVGFDAPFLMTQNKILTRGFLGDTMIAQHILYPDFPRGLDFITSIHTNEPYYKDEGKQHFSGIKGDIAQFWRYCARDAVVALEAWYVLAKEMTDNGYWDTYNLTARMAQPLMFMTARGLKVDDEALTATKARLKSELAEREKELLDAAEYEFNVNSPAQVKKYFYETKGLKPYLNTKTGQPTTDDKAMARIVRRDNLPEARLVQQIRNLKKLIGTYMEVRRDEDGRLRCSWDPRGTWTGRLSSRKTLLGTGMNLQNVDPRFKGFIIADD